MGIFHAQGFAERQGITERFAPEAKGLIPPMNPGGDNDREATAAREAAGGVIGGTDRLNLNPPDDSPAAKLERIAGLIRKGEPARALERAALLLNGPALDSGLKLKLRQAVEAGLHDLAIAGRANDARYFRLQLAASLDLAPESPRPYEGPQFQPRIRAPAYGMAA